jgi:SPP1 gp7 family putative phage head morphogenesis protein
MAEYHRNSDRTINTITAAYDKAIADINKELDKIFSKVAKDGRISPEEARRLLNEPVSSRELDELRDQLNVIKDPEIKRQLLNRLNSPAYRARMTRLQALKEQIYIESKKIADVELQASTTGYIDTINGAYYKNLFDIQKGFGVGFDVAAMPAKTIESILKNPWSSKHFSGRVWRNTDVLAGKLTEVITAGFKSGASIRKMSLELEDMSAMGKHAAVRLVRTETTYMANAAEMESYKEAEIEEYIFVATLDLRTSKICRKYDGRVFKVKDAVPGKNMPALHPYCRSTTRASFGPDTLKGIQRRARDPVTGKTYLVPADMTYDQWYEEYVVNKYGRDQAEVMKKKVLNDAADRKQYERYKAMLGADAPNSFVDGGSKNGLTEVKSVEDLQKYSEELLKKHGKDSKIVLGTSVPKSFAGFQELKYNRVEEWKQLELNYKKQKVRNTIKSDAQIKAIEMGQQRKHIPGTLEYQQYQNKFAKQGQYGPSRVNLNHDELQGLVDKYAGTGEIKLNDKAEWDHREIIRDNSSIVGKVVNNLTGAEAETTIFKIHYGKKGAHVVPDYPSKKGGDKID